MSKHPELSASIISQIALMQSVVAQLPEKVSMLEFACRGLKDVAGVGQARYFLISEEPEDSVTLRPDLSLCRNFYVCRNKKIHAIIELSVTDEVLFNPYVPYIENFCNMLAVIFEELRQKEENQRLLQDLERRVEERTAQLEMEVSERKTTEIFLQLTRQSIDAISDCVYWIDQEARFIYVNNSACLKLEYTREEFKELTVFDIDVLFPKNKWAEHWADLLTRGSFSLESVHRSKSGREYSVEIGLTLVEFGGRQYNCAVVRDITERKQIQSKLFQIQKLDSLGQLAGGVAHDFNNMLGGILGAADLLKFQIESGDYSSCDSLLTMIIETAQRAGSLTQKLLSFARCHPMDFTVMDLHKVVEDTIALLSRTVDKRIEISSELKALDSMVNGDMAQLQNVFLNMGINASHAMPEGGNLIFCSREVLVDESYISVEGRSLSPGRYIEVEVRDTGSGIPPEILPKIFDPFFTTKSHEKGTGLGLSAAMGTVLQHHGAITVYSEVGKGTSFKVYIPLTDLLVKSENSHDSFVHGHGLVLFADDEKVIRETGKAMMEKFGFKVVTACNGAEALKIFKEYHSDIRLVILDMIMPVMNGRDCFYHLKKINPHVKVLLASGFSREEELSDLKRNGLDGFIMKPFRIYDLSRAIAEILRLDEARQ